VVLDLRGAYGALMIAPYVPYTRYGIPDHFEGKYSDIPIYAIKIGGHETGDLLDDPSGLCISQVRLWGQVDSWTALEAALLLAGVAPDDPELYGVVSEGMPREVMELIKSEDFQFMPIGNLETYTWKYAKIFHGARDYLFLFERSELAPKAPPIEWVKYFNLKIRNAPIKYPFEPHIVIIGKNTFVLSLMKLIKLKIRCQVQ